MEKLMCVFIVLLIFWDIFIAAVLAYYGRGEAAGAARNGSLFVTILSILNAVTLGGMYAWAF